MGRKVTIIGAGNVGATIAYTLSLGDMASDIVLIDINKEKAEGEVMDIAHGASFRDPISVITGDYEAARKSDIVIITSGINRKPGQSRLELTKTNVEIMKDVTPKIAKVCPDSLYVLVNNPVDITTYVFTKLSGLPERQILGSGTILDTSRLRYDLSQHFQIAQKNIHAYVYGEHGDSSFVPWSTACVSACSLNDYEKLMLENGSIKEPLDRDGIMDYVRKCGGTIISKKGATFYAISVSVSKLCSTLMGSNDSLTTISSMMHGEYGIEDVCLSTLTRIGPQGVKGKVPIKLTDEEVEKLRFSANTVKNVIKQIEF